MKFLRTFDKHNRPTVIDIRLEAMRPDKNRKDAGYRCPTRRWWPASLPRK